MYRQEAKFENAIIIDGEEYLTKADVIFEEDSCEGDYWTPPSHYMGIIDITIQELLGYNEDIDEWMPVTDEAIIEKAKEQIENDFEPEN